jgi:hypothetical protein
MIPIPAQNATISPGTINIVICFWLEQIERQTKLEMELIDDRQGGFHLLSSLW